MEFQQIHMLLWCTAGVMALAVFSGILLLALRKVPQAVASSLYDKVSVRLSGSRNSIFDYAKREAFLLRSGAAYHYGKWVEPVKYLAMQILLAGAGMLVGGYYHLLLGIVAAIVLFGLPDYLLIAMNKKDNENLTGDLKLVYNALSVQIQAGVHASDALMECYDSVSRRNPRLKEALLDLSGDLIMKADMEEALGNFQKRFDNRYIDSLCLILLQAMESGQAIGLLSDVAEQVKDMEAAMLLRKKGALDRHITLYQLGIMVSVLAVVIYACVTQMVSSAIGF